MNIERVVFSEFGEPARVLQLETATIAPPARGEALIRMEMAPVNPADLNFIEGKYGIRPELPAVAGLEGGAIVEALGPDTDGPPPGVRVLPPLSEGGCWQSARVVQAADLSPLPSGMTPEQVATLRVNPSTAFRLLTDFAALKPGDWVVQNGANSAVGRHVIQLAKHRGLRTVNFVRRPELIAELTASGADLVLLDDDTAKQHVRDALGDANVLLGLNCVGGESAARLSSILSPKATMVTYGAMSRKALTVSNAHLIFKEIQFKGFWVTRWIKEATPDARQQMFTELAELAKSGVIKTPIEQIYPLADVLTAVGRAAGSSRNGKILLKLS